MAVIYSFLAPTPLQGQHLVALAATTASGEQVSAHGMLVNIFATGIITVRLGTSGSVGTPTATSGGYDFAIPANVPLTFAMPRAYDSFKVFNTTAGTVDVFWSPFSQTA